ncbi:class I SAM-dependent methyltransferase, partial [archaeon]
MEEARRELAKAKAEIARLQKLRDEVALEAQKAKQDVLISKQDTSKGAPDYGSKEYWSQRYEKTAPSDAKSTEQDEMYEWYVPFSSISSLVDVAVSRVEKQANHIFIPGVGNSTLAEEMAIKYPGKVILANDFDEALICRMQARAQAKGLLNLQYIAGDLRRLPVDSGSQGLVLDKGTLDAIAGGDSKVGWMYITPCILHYSSFLYPFSNPRPHPYT